MRMERVNLLFLVKLLTTIIILYIIATYYWSRNGVSIPTCQLFGKQEREFLVFSENCQIMTIDPYDKIYNYTPPTAPNCSMYEPLIVKQFNKQTKKYILRLDMNLKDLYTQNNTNTLQCCYRNIIREGDKNIKFLPCIIFEQEFVVPTHINYMLIHCFKNNEIVYQDGLTFIQEPLKVRNKLKKQSNYTHRPFGILLYGIDSISQFNFRRVMPKTFQYVQNNSWFELSGYNKIDDNTFPNMMAIFAGYNAEATNKICKPSKKIALDNCPTLFKQFNEQGIITAYSEDECSMSTFTYLKLGFLQSPTDYYQRPLLMAIEKALPFKKLSKLHYCIGSRRSAEYVYDFSIEFAERFLGKAIFGLFWTNTFSHSKWFHPSTMDQRMVDYFKDMDNRRILENNVVILLSDHGARWGFLRKQKDGYNEERLPMFFLRLPKTFQLKYPQFTEAFKTNKYRLTSPYDVHMTLKHLALLAQGKDDVTDSLTLPLSCPTCQTLFKPVAQNRSCGQASITDHWCTCLPFQSLEAGTDKMQNLTNLVIHEINAYLQSHGYGNKCAHLEFKHNIEANLLLKLPDTDWKPNEPTYRLTFEVLPNNATFDATFTHNESNNSISIVVPEISRLNVYAEDAKCVTDNNIVKKFCICYESVIKQIENIKNN